MSNLPNPRNLWSQQKNKIWSKNNRHLKGKKMVKHNQHKLGRKRRQYAERFQVSQKPQIAEISLGRCIFGVSRPTCPLAGNKKKQKCKTTNASIGFPPLYCCRTSAMMGWSSCTQLVRHSHLDAMTYAKSSIQILHKLRGSTPISYQLQITMPWPMCTRLRRRLGFYQHCHTVTVSLRCQRRRN